MPDAPEDRAAAARRVARKIVDGKWVFLRAPIEQQGVARGALDKIEDEIAVALLAFPGGDAEPVAWRYHSTLKSFPSPWKYVEREEDCNPHKTYERQPLYTAPVAGEAGALRESLEAAKKRHRRCRTWKCLPCAERAVLEAQVKVADLRAALRPPSGVTDAGE